ncbi:MAG TPA: diguanylate cyclase, partial [Acidothermaceae bacterium]|nr:diguanylate cyclase [Acidothermaceae bacterium]
MSRFANPQLRSAATLAALVLVVAAVGAIGEPRLNRPELLFTLRVGTVLLAGLIVVGWRRFSRSSAAPVLESQAAALADVHAELSRRQSFYDALLETVEVGIVSCDADGVVVVSNRVERAIFGLADGLNGLLPEQFAPHIDVLEPSGRHLNPDEYPLMRTLRGEQVDAIDMVVGPTGGPHREIVVRGRQITTPDGEVLGAVAALTDVTDERVASRALVEERRRLTEAQRLGQLGSFDYDFASATWTCSEQLAVLWGVEWAGFVPEMTRRVVLPEDLAAFSQGWAAACQRGGFHSYDYRIRRATDGAVRLIRSNVEVELDVEGRPMHGRGTHMDITELNAAKEAAQRAHAFFDAVLTANPDYTFVTEVASGAVIYGSRGKDILGITTEQFEALDQQALGALVHPDELESVRSVNAIGANLDDGDLVQIRYRGLHADGTWRWLNMRVTPFRRNDAGHCVEVLAIVRDVTDVVHAEERLTYAARHDSLTGLPNRAQLVERLDAALVRSARENREVAVLFCDLDGFKRVNDTGGHSAGDAVLLETARRLRSVLRPDDTVARVGGDEFVMLVEPWHRRERERDAAGVPLADGPTLGGPLHRALAVTVAERVV